MVTSVKIETWKSIEIGTSPKTTDELRRALEDKGRVVNHTASIILDKITFAGKKTKVDLVKLSIQDLGFVSFDEARYVDLLARARQSGLGLCQSESVIKLCLQDLEQTNERYLIAMEPVESDKHAGHLCILRIFFKDGVLLLVSASFPPEAAWPMESTLIFQSLS